MDVSTESRGYQTLPAAPAEPLSALQGENPGDEWPSSLLLL